MRLKLAALLTALLATALASQFAVAEVKVADAWVRATVPAQKATGAFMTLTADKATRLIAASSAAAEVTEVHEMAMTDGIMTMRHLEKGLELPAGKAVELKPGGYHVMLMGLKAPVKEGSTVPLTLSLQDADGKSRTVAVEAVVKPLAAPAAGSKHH
ncbi:MAG: copper chaperone PCu(A)C [Rhodocyclaceae bacterium]|nr:copper chaperone PCu(A)C [Rhodocyclaceae bacterium]